MSEKSIPSLNCLGIVREIWSFCNVRDITGKSDPFCKKLWCCLVFNLFFLLIFLMVCCKQELVAEAEAVLSFIIF